MKCKFPPRSDSDGGPHNMAYFQIWSSLSKTSTNIDIKRWLEMILINCHLFATA